MKVNILLQILLVKRFFRKNKKFTLERLHLYILQNRKFIHLIFQLVKECSNASASKANVQQFLMPFLVFYDVFLQI